MPLSAVNGRNGNRNAPMFVAGLTKRKLEGAGRFKSAPLVPINYLVSGQTLDSVGVIVPFATVHLFDAATDVEVAQGTSDGVGFYYLYSGYNSGNFYVTAYKPGAPDIMGTTVNTLVAV